MLSDIFFNFLAALVFLFFFWKKLKEDYIPNQIFSTAFSAILGILLANILAFNFFPLWWFWASFIGFWSGLAISIYRFKLRFFEVLDSSVIATLPWLLIIFLIDSVSSSSTPSLIASVFILLLIAIYLFFDAHYRKFTWYKSGRIGFSGLAVAGTFFLGRSLVALAFDNVLSFVGKIDIYISALLAAVSFFAVISLSKKEI